MVVYSPEQEIVFEKKIGEGFTWVIERSKSHIAVVDGGKAHVQIATEAGFCNEEDKFPPVFDGGQLNFTVRAGWLIPADFTSSTSPEALQGLILGTPAFDEAFKNMRVDSAQMLANCIGDKITAEFRDGTSKIFYPQEE